jgi:amino acid adenylation domain-containing protein/non-ribosomal peptide synthase protein (TIGR01720 family)
MSIKKDGISERRSKLSASKRALLEKRLRGEFESNSQVTVIPRRSQQSPVPLSFAQQRLWLLHQLESDNPAYNELASIQILGALNIEALQESLNEIVQRHESLRTSFESVEGQPTQVIHPFVTFTLPVVNLCKLPEVQKDEVERLTTEIAQTPFDLGVAPLLRGTVLQTGEQEYLLLFVIHHIATDGSSTKVLVRELTVLYEAFTNGQPSPLPELPIQYADFAVWQRQWLQKEVLDNQLLYWKQQLANAPNLLELPTDRPRPPVQTFRGAIASFELSPNLTGMLKSLSNQEGVTLFMILLAAFQTLLYRYTGQKDICVGSPIANRNQPEIQGLIGFFANTLVLRTDLSSNPSFLELLERVREVCMSAYAHAHLPFERLVEELHPERNLSHSPLFQVMFALQEDNEKDLTLPGLTLNWLQAHSKTAKFDLSLYVVNNESELSGWLEYNTDLFNADTITRMLGHFHNLLEGIVANPQAKLSQLPLLSAAELHQLLVAWNDTHAEYPLDKCIHELFEVQVERTPDAVAVVFEDVQLTYRQLNERANQLAHYLRSLGVKPEVLVGICVKRSLEMVIGLLGILKAGGAYVPLDPNYPQERLAFMLEDAQASILLSQSELVAQLPQHSTQVVCLDSDWEIINLENKQNLISKVLPENTSYILYTSGSTGKPKAVVIEHRNTVAFLDWVTKVFSREQLAAVLASTSICFDLSVFEVFGTLCCGGEVILAENALSLPTLAAAKQVTLINTVPSAIAELLRLDNVPDSVTTINLAGEPLHASLVQQIYQHTKVEQVFNLYGPSEDTTYSTFAYLQQGDDIITIGRPIANTQCFVLDEQMQLVPTGVCGELYIAGAGLTRGYLNRPQLTAQKFVPNPFSDKGGDLLYKTGDLVRYLPSGDIEYIGRIDHQVKLRGFRIELGEIEALLDRHLAVSSSVVVVREDVPGNKNLVAYITSQPDQTLAIASLRQFLESKLPGYMVPSAFVMLEALPLTPNGKVDRRALPVPDHTQLIQQSNFVAASTPAEQILAQIWTEVLGIDNIGIHGNFFELGGHSLLATRVISQIQQVFKVELPLRRLFEQPTIAGLAKDIETATKADLLLELPPIQRIRRSQDLPLSFAQQRLWFLAQLEPDSPFYNISATIRLQGQLNIAALEQSFNEILRRHEALRTNFKTVEGQPVAVISPVKSLLLPVIDLLELPPAQRETKVRQLALAEAQQSFNLNTDTLLRVKLLRLEEQEYVALFTMHHIVSDGWSMEILLLELGTLYLAFSKGQPSPLAELPIQYADFAAWQRQSLTASVLQSQLTYWQQQLKGAPELLELPTDHPRPAVKSFKGASHDFELSPELSTRLKNFSQQQGCTLFMVLLAGFKTLLYRYTHSSDIVVGSPIANRHHKQIEGLIGFFVNTLVLRTDLSGNPSFVELLSRVKEVALGAYAHQDLPFEQLLDKLHTTRNTSHTPLFGVMFVLQNAQKSQLALPGLSLSSLSTNNGTAKFDLTLDMRETALGLRGTIEYSSDLFEADTITRMVSHLQTLLNAIVANPQAKLEQLPLLTQTERHQLLVEWNDTKAEYPLDKCIHELFEATVERTPDAVAVVFEDVQTRPVASLTYRQLNQRANQLAHYLRSLGVQPGVQVGICVERSLEMVIGLLGILKAGGAYVPLDPSYPQERLTFMLEDSQTAILLSQQHLVESLPIHKAQVICLDSNWELIAHKSIENPVCNLTPNHLAYVIYTSGSTGRPKGAMNTHRGICNRLIWMQDAYQLTAADCVLQKTPFSFDVSVWEFFWPLLFGARLVVARPDGHRDPNYLVNLINKSQITTLHFVPSMLQAFVEAEGLENCKSIKRVICSGEALSVELQKRFFARLPAQLHNLYGPTEAAIDVTSWQCQRQSERAIVPIGRPIANTQIYILDSNGQPVPVGVPGELHIGGKQLALGYLNRPQLTAQKFVPNPFSKISGDRLYKTGDLVRYLPNGDIEYIGRIDHQVKLRGFRIELGEIEALLNQHLAVSSSVVVVREDVPGNKNLVAYITLQPEQTLKIAQLRQFLESKLPNYMVPSAFVMLEALPLTPNGKVDRRALPAPDRIQLIQQSNFVAASTPVEQILAGIWTEVLGINNIGIHDNFFELGGDSIIGIQVIAKANQAGLKLTPRHLFQHQTIAELATAACITQTIQADQGLVTGEVHLTPIQHWFFAQNQLDPHHWNQSLLLEMRQVCNPKLLEQVVQHLIEHHDALRLRFLQKESGWQQIHAQSSDTVVFTQVDLSGLPEIRQKSAIESVACELQASLNLSQGPLVRVTLFDLGKQQNSRLLIVIHHLAVDGVSWRILLEDLQTAYQQIIHGEAIQLADKTTSFKQWAQYLQEYAQSSKLIQEQDYWLAEIQKPLASLPVDYFGGDNTVANTDTVSVSLNKKETQALLKEIHKTYSTQINDVLLTALVQAFAKWTGEQSLWLDIEGHGREEIFKDANLSRTVGWFTTCFPVLLKITEACDRGNALIAVKEHLRSIPNRGIGYGVLRYLTSDQEIKSKLQAFGQPQVSFNYLGQFDQMISESSLFDLAAESSGLSHSPRTRRVYLLEVNGMVVKERLQMNWTYSKAIHRPETIATLAFDFIEALRKLIVHCQSLDSERYTPSDFPKANLSQQKLDRFLAKISRASENKGK